MVLHRLWLFPLILLVLNGCTTKDWRTASRESTGTAPNPATDRKR